MGRGTKALLAGAGVVGVAAVGRLRRHHDGDGVVAVTVLRPPEDVTREGGGQAVAGDLDVTPAPADRGTEVRVAVDGGGEGLVERVRGETPAQQARDRLRRLKSTLEAGEVITTEGQPSGRGPVAEALTEAVSRRLRSWGAS